MKRKKNTQNIMEILNNIGPKTMKNGNQFGKHF